MEETIDAKQELECSHCGQNLLVESALAGTNVNCPTCNGGITIPVSQSSPPTKNNGLQDPEEFGSGDLLNPHDLGIEGSSKPNTALGYFISIIVRLVWSLTLGAFIFFPIGLTLFIFLDIFKPESNIGYRTLVYMCKWGSCHWFKGVKLQMETDDFDVRVQKERQKRPWRLGTVAESRK